MSMSGADYNKMFKFKVTDRNIYDQEGHVVDSVTADKMVKSMDYGISLVSTNGQESFRRTLTKINPKQQESIYQSLKDLPHALRSRRLQDGLTLDLKPISQRVDTAKLLGKAIIMIFWCTECYSGAGVPNQYHAVNDVISTYYNPDKLQVIAITDSPFDVAAEALKKSPILNARNVFEASGITDAYQTDNRPVIVMTDKAHKILFSISNNAGVTVWMLNKLLKENVAN
ncbi:MAG: hypothetical protein JWQ34_1823 [Mucilaginibacter sp.]|nr:hypothetical protein [Mucilaginibacter sp.]